MNFLSILTVENFQVFARWVVQGWTFAIKRSFLLVNVWTATHASPKETLHFLEFIPGLRFPGMTLNLFLLCLRVTFSSKRRCAFIIEILKIFRFPILIWKSSKRAWRNIIINVRDKCWGFRWGFLFAAEKSVLPLTVAPFLSF